MANKVSKEVKLNLNADSSNFKELLHSSLIASLDSLNQKVDCGI